MRIPKINVRIAQSKYNSFPSKTHHHTTSLFGEFRPVYYRNLQEGDKLSVSVADMIRTEPLIYPTYGEVIHKLHAFFVPYRLITEHFKEFITGSKYLAGQTVQTPKLLTLHPDYIIGIFIGTYGALGLTEVVGGANNVGDVRLADGGVDFVLPSADGADSPFTMYRLTRLGRSWLKVFNSLGYSWNWVTGLGNTVKPFNIINLLSFMQIYLDYFCPSYYVESHPFNSIISAIKMDDVALNSQSNLASALSRAMQEIKLPYDLDFFTASWEKFNAPLANSSTDTLLNKTFAIPNPLGENEAAKDVVRVNSDGTYLSRSSSPTGNLTSFSALGVRLLEQIANLVNREHFAGSRPVEKLLAKFGIKVPEYTMDRCVYLGSDLTQIQISDVTNLAESEGHPLGDYAGRMIGRNNGVTFNCEAKEYGVFMIVSTIMPKIDYFQGYDRFNVISDRFEFYTPEFAKLGNEAVSVGELFADLSVNSYDVALDHDIFQSPDIGAILDTLSRTGNTPVDVFGFMQRYANFKVGRSFVTGDYRVGHLKRDLEPFHLNRILLPTQSLRAQGNFLYVDASQYDRIFQLKSDKADQFYPIYYFDTKLLSKMESFGDSLPITDGQDSESQDLGGSPLN